MQPVPRIFVSATSRDLRTARGLVSEGLRRMECLPIVQDDFPPDYKSVREMLRTKLETCNAVVHLAGFYYGAEPQPVLEGSPERRSFTQLEYEIAVELGLPCYVFLCGKDYPFDEHEPEPEDKQALQLAHRARLLERDELYYEFETREDLNSRTRELQLSVEGLRKELAKERARRRMTMVVSAVALLVAVAGGIFLYSKTQSQEAVIAETTSKLDEQSELIAMLLAEQARLRESIDGGGVDVVARAEANVAKATGRTPEEIRAAVEEEIRAAEAAVAGATDPAVKVAALLRLAEGEAALGRNTEAIAAYRERLALLDRDEQPVEWAGTVVTLAELVGRWDRKSMEPVEILREGVDWAEANPELGREHPATLELMLALSKERPVSLGESIELGQHVLEVRERELGMDAPETVDAAWTLAMIRRMADEFEEADALFLRVIAALDERLGAGSERTLSARWTYAQSLADQGRLDEAETVIRQAVATSTEVNGPGAEATLDARLGLAMFLADHGDSGETTAYYRGLLADAESSLGSESGMATMLMGTVASRLRREESFEESEALTRRQLEILVATIGPDQEQVVDAMGDLARVLDAQEKSEAYQAAMLEKIATAERLFGADSLAVAADQYSLAVDYIVNRLEDLAVPLLEASYETRKQRLGAADERTLKSVDALCVAFARAEDWVEVRRWSGLALGVYDESEDAPEEMKAGFEEYQLLAEERGENL